jgi:hypothetical protein
MQNVLGLAKNPILGTNFSSDSLAIGGWWERSVGLACGEINRLLDCMPVFCFLSARVVFKAL